MTEVNHPTYKLGAQGTIVLRFYDVGTGLPGDPTSFNVTIQRKHGRLRDTPIVITNLSAGVSHPSTGVYHYVTPEFVRGTIWGSGTYFVEADGDGVVEAGEKSWFKVEPSRIVT